MNSPPSSILASKTSISGRQIMGRAAAELSTARGGSDVFPISTVDFESVRFTSEEAEDAQMVWWLVLAYFPCLDIKPHGTRAEMILAVRLLVCHLRICSGMPPAIDPAWAYHKRRCIGVAFHRLCNILDTKMGGHQHHPGSNEWGDATTLLHWNVLVHLSPMMQKLSHAATGLSGADLQPVATTANDSLLLAAAAAAAAPAAAAAAAPAAAAPAAAAAAPAAAAPAAARRMLGTFREEGQRWWTATWPSNRRWFFTKKAQRP